MKKILALVQAQTMIQVALDQSKNESFKPMATAVLDDAGNLKA